MFLNKAKGGIMLANQITNSKQCVTLKRAYASLTMQQTFA